MRKAGSHTVFAYGPGATGDIHRSGKMASFHFYFASCALLLTLSWRPSTGRPSTGSPSTGLPVGEPSGEEHGDCSELFRNLLRSIADVLKDDDLCFGIPANKMVVMSKAETVLACAPTLTQNSTHTGCMMQRNSSFSESECRRNIRKDLAYYAAAIQSYLKSSLRSHEKEAELLSPILETVQNLRTKFPLMPDEEKDSSEDDAARMWGGDSFSNRQVMCKMMRGFHIRTITINRAMGYISSGDHRK